MRENPILLRSDAEAMRYGTMVADAYLAAPSFDEANAWRWQVLIEHIEKLFERIQRGRQGVKVVFVEGQPYADERALQRGVDETGILYVSVDYNTHPIFTPTQNLKFRAVHDYMTHIARDVTFGLRGEIAAYNAHAKMAPPDAVPALFTEVLAQAATYVTKGFFPEQKIALLPFDYYRVGIEVAGEGRGPRRRANPPMPPGFTFFSTDDVFGEQDDASSPSLTGTQQVFREMQRGDVVSVGKTKWIILRPLGSVQAWAYKHPSQHTKQYEIRLDGLDNDTVVVFEVGGSAQRISDDLVRGPLRMTDERMDPENLKRPARR